VTIPSQSQSYTLPPFTTILEPFTTAPSHNLLLHTTSLVHNHQLLSYRFPQYNTRFDTSTSVTYHDDGSQQTQLI